MRSMTRALALPAALLLTTVLAACSTAPKDVDQATFKAESQAAVRWFENNVVGLEQQMDDSAAYIIFPDVAQWGILFSGGTWGRGALMSAEGEHIGWAALNSGSIGLQAGVQGFKMLIVMESAQDLADFKENKLTGSVDGVAVGGEAGGSGTATFTEGLAVYQGANTGLMAGVNVGFKYIRYQPLGAE